MNSRERLLTALDGGAPDRVPCALSFYSVDLQELAPPDSYRDDWVDVHFVPFPLSPEEQALHERIAPYDYDTRLGTPSQAAMYEHWDYHPETPARRNPLAHVRSLDDLRAYPFPDSGDPYRVASLAREVASWRARGLAVGGNLPHLGGELFEAAWRLRGLENFLLDLIERPGWADYLLDRLAALACRNAEALAAAGVDVLALDDDVGMPGTMFISPALWRRFFKPRMADIIGAARAIRPGVRVLYHSDGYFEPILGDLMEIGVNAINPLQPEHMDAARIRRKFGPRRSAEPLAPHASAGGSRRSLALWGTVGHQNLFGWGTPEDIRREVKMRVETLGRAGLVLCPAYDVDTPDIPWENVAAFLEAVREYG